MKKKIGIMGGTFDPIHIGHLMLGEKAYEQYTLDQVWFMPAGNPPHKQHREGRATDRQRIEMVQKAIQGNSHFSLSLADMHPGEYSYTYRLLERMKEEYRDTEFYFIIGGDSLRDFDTWKEPERICRAAHLLVAQREHMDQKKLLIRIKELKERFHGEFSLLDIPGIGISSQMLREWIEQGSSVRYFVPDSVNIYIQEQKLYQR